MHELFDAYFISRLRFDSTTFKKKMPEIYTAYLKQVTSKRFSIA